MPFGPAFCAAETVVSVPRNKIAEVIFAITRESRPICDQYFISVFRKRLAAICLPRHYLLALLAAVLAQGLQPRHFLYLAVAKPNFRPSQTIRAAQLIPSPGR